MTEPITTPAGPPSPDRPPRSDGRRRSPTFHLYRLLLDLQVTTPRLVLLGAAGLFAVGVALALRNSGQSNPDQVGAVLIAVYGLELFVPVTALLLAAAALGDLNDDGSLVYLWLRPVPRWRIVAASVASSLTVTLPLTLVPLVGAALLSGARSQLALATLVAVPVSLLAYCPVFCALGLRSRRSLLWGLLYIFIWEGFVARAGGFAAWMAIRCYAESILVDITGATLDQAVIDPPWTWVVPLAVGAVAAAYAVRRLHVQDIP